MKIQRLLVALTLANFGLLIFLLLQVRLVEAQSVAPVLRGRELQIVDEGGKIRASIKVQPADKAVRTPDGEAYPETVILRLIDSNGQPSVKLQTSLRGAGLAIVGGDDASYAVLGADLKESSLKMTNKDGRQHLIKP